MKPIDQKYVAALRDLTVAFEAIGLRIVLIGGLAVCLVARPRFTKDIDALLIFDTDLVEGLLFDLEARGFDPRFSGMADFARQARFIGLIHRASGVAIDIALGCMPFEEEVIGRSTQHRDEEVALRLPTPEDLIILKAIANRPQDLIDITTIAEVNPTIDRGRIQYWLEQFGELMETPDLWERTELLLGHWR
jgi:hypothetical protein